MNYPVQTLNFRALEEFKKKIEKIKDESFRVIDLGENYKFIGYLDVQEFLDTDIIHSKTSLVGINFSEVSPDINSFEHPNILIKYLKLRQDYLEWCLHFASNYPNHEKEFKRDLESEKAFSELIEGKSSQIDDKKFEL